MAAQPRLVLHAIPYSHPCLAVSTALDRYGLEYETEALVSGKHTETVEGIYGEGNGTVPGLLVDDEPVHGSTAIFRRLDDLVEAELYPEAVADAVREAEAGLIEELQVSARVLIFGSLHFRPEALGTFAGVASLDPAGVDFAIKTLRAAWRYTGTDAQRIHEELQKLPSLLDLVDELAAAGVIGGEEPTAADFQIGSSLHLMLQVGDVRPLLEGRTAAAIVEAWFEPGSADVPAGAFPAGWTPAADT
jgi:glutathione S-transferase